MLLRSRKLALYGMFTSLAILAGYIEALIPPPVAIQGVKLGIANVIVLIMMYSAGALPALCVSIMRVVLCGFLFNGMFGMLYSLAGGVLSFALMYAAKRVNVFSIIGVSVVGAIAHNIGQVLLAMLIIANVKMALYLPVLLVSGVITGVLIGLTAKYTLKHIPNTISF